MLSKNIRVYVEILPSFAVEGGNDILQHPVVDLGGSLSISASVITVCGVLKKLGV